MLAYQVWVWTMSAPAAAAAIRRSTDSTPRTSPLGPPATSGHGWWAVTCRPSRGAPKQWTSRSTTLASSRLR